MKERITTDQLVELNDVQKRILRKLWQPKQGDMFCAIDSDNNVLNAGTFPKGVSFIENKGVYPLLSIKQLCEFLADDAIITEDIADENICDDMWEVFKEEYLFVD